MRSLRRTLMVAVALVVAATAAAAVETTISDTISIIKGDVRPANVDIAVALSENTPLPVGPTSILVSRDDDFADALASGVLQSNARLLLVPSTGPLGERVRAEIARVGPESALVLGGTAAVGSDVEQELRDLGLDVARAAGASRLETATRIADLAPDGDTVIVARAFAADPDDPTQAFADALAAGGWAAETRWPILLTETDRLSTPTREWLAARDMRRAVILGGTAAISEAVAADLEGLVDVVDRVAGPTRADTALEVAKARGADTAADVDRVVLVDGSSPDAWAGGFAAAAHSAALDAPIVLAVGGTLPPATTQFLTGGAGFAVDVAGGGGLTCVTLPAVCEQARGALAFPNQALVTFTPVDGTTVQAGQPVTVEVRPNGDDIAGATLSGTCLAGPAAGQVQPDGTVTIQTEVSATPGDRCTVSVEVARPDDVVQTTTATYPTSLDRTCVDDPRGDVQNLSDGPASARAQQYGDMAQLCVAHTGSTLLLRTTLYEALPIEQWQGLTFAGWFIDTDGDLDDSVTSAHEYRAFFSGVRGDTGDYIANVHPRDTFEVLCAAPVLVEGASFEAAIPRDCIDNPAQIHANGNYTFEDTQAPEGSAERNSLDAAPPFGNWIGPLAAGPAG